MSVENNENNIVLSQDDQAVLDLWASESELQEKGLNRPNRHYQVVVMKDKAVSFIKKHILFDYFVRRIFMGLISIFLMISIIFIVFRLTVPNAVYLQGITVDAAIKPGTEKYQHLLNSRLHQLRLDGSLWEQLWKFWDSILPFHKKAILINPSNQLAPDGSLIGFTVIYRWLYYGEMLTTALGDKQAQVSDVIKSGIGVSTAFTVVALIFVYAIGISIGLGVARRKGRRGDKVIGGVSTLIQSTPPVILLLIIFYITTFLFHWHTTYSSGSITAKIAPIIVLVVFQLPYIISTTRHLAADELEKSYTKFSRSVGKTESSIYAIHIMRSITISLLRTIPVAFMTTFFGIALLTETYWGIPGVSKIIINGIMNNEVFVIQTYIVLMLACLSGLSVIFDVLTAALNYEFRK
jgi:oligopeptide transport system permease protein